MNIVFLDIETTGLDPIDHEPLEIAMIARLPNPAYADETIHFSLEIDAQKADPAALKINRYDERQAELQAILKSNVAACSTLVGVLRDALVVGNNVQFDLRFIEQFLARNGVKRTARTSWHYAPLDLKAWVAGRCGMPKPASTKLIAEVAGVPLPDDQHSALADVEWNRAVYDALRP